MLILNDLGFLGCLTTIAPRSISNPWLKWHRHASPFRVPAIRAREQADGVYFRPAMSQGAELVAGRGELQDARVHDNAGRGGGDLHPLAA
jgi:hypothetical protein